MYDPNPVVHATLWETLHCAVLWVPLSPTPLYLVNSSFCRSSLCDDSSQHWYWVSAVNAHPATDKIHHSSYHQHANSVSAQTALTSVFVYLVCGNVYTSEGQGGRESVSFEANKWRICIAKILARRNCIVGKFGEIFNLANWWFYGKSPN